MELIDEYLVALEVGDAERVLALFAPDGIVHSPLYGDVPARQFYPTLFADTAEIRLRLRRVFRDDSEAVAFWFDFTWVLADGTSASSAIVDIAELTKDGLIASLHIVYDTAPIRGDFEQAKRNRKPSEHQWLARHDYYNVLPPDSRWPTLYRALRLRSSDPRKRHLKGCLRGHATNQRGAVGIDGSSERRLGSVPRSASVRRECSTLARDSALPASVGTASSDRRRGA